jgi:hypothetical protein
MSNVGTTYTSPVGRDTKYTALFMVQAADGNLLTLDNSIKWSLRVGMVWGTLDSLAVDLCAAVARQPHTPAAQKLKKDLATATIVVFNHAPFASITVHDFLAKKGMYVEDFL